jgi:DinB superfamily
MDPTERAKMLAGYRGGYEAVVDALAGASDEELDRVPKDGEGWSARMVVHHLADSEATAYIRLRRLIAEDQPSILGYDEGEFARRLHYDRPIDSSLEVLKGVRAGSLSLLESLAPDEWGRSGTHSESGAYSVEGWLRIYVRHPHEHAEQIRRAREGRV